MENFDNVKVGDKVVVCSNWGKRICEVDKVTPKRFKIGGRYFDKKDGLEYGSGYNFDHCLHVTDELVNEIARTERFAKMRRTLRNVCVDKYNYEQTKKLYDFMIENSLIEEPKD